LLLRSLPVVAPKRLAQVSTSASRGSRQQCSYATFDQIRQHTDIFDGAPGYTDCCGTAILNVGSENQSADRGDLIVVAVQDQRGEGDLLQVLGEVRFRNTP